MGQISLLDGLDWRPGSRLDSDRLRSLPASRDPVEEDVERRVRALEAEARALVRSIDWAGGRDAGRPHRPGHGQWVRPHLLRCIGGAMLVVRAPHLTNRRRQRLLDAFDACFAWERANLDAAPDGPRHDHGAASFNRTVRQLARVDPVRLAEVAARDRWTCGLCRLPVLRRAPRWIRVHPMAASIDHVVPLSRGGADTRGNARLAHGWCNTLRGDDNGLHLERARREPRPEHVLGATLAWEREHGGEHLASMRRLGMDVAAEEARLADPAATAWARPAWYLDLLRQALTRRAVLSGFCVTCLLGSPWPDRPLFVRHRRADFHEDATGPAARS